MTTEQKAKAYDEAIKKAKDMLYYKEVRQEDMEYLFPELKESEDERIRKALVRFHKSTIDIDGIKGEQIVAWLEKQGETYTKRDVDNAFVEGMALAKKELEKQGEQKPVMITPEKSLGISSEEYNKIVDDCIYGEEQKPAEWSKEDEEMLEGIIDAVKDVRCQSLLSEIEIYDDYIDWLKSLKDRYIWKPTKEQLKALQMVRDSHCFMYQQDRINIKTLLEQLKSL